MRSHHAWGLLHAWVSAHESWGRHTWSKTPAPHQLAHQEAAGVQQGFDYRPAWSEQPGAATLFLPAKHFRDQFLPRSQLLAGITAYFPQLNIRTAFEIIPVF